MIGTMTSRSSHVQRGPAGAAKDQTGGGHGCLPRHQLQKTGVLGPERTWPQPKVKTWWVQCWHFEAEETIGLVAWSTPPSFKGLAALGGAERSYHSWLSPLHPRLPGLKRSCPVSHNFLKNFYNTQIFLFPLTFTFQSYWTIDKSSI